MADLEELRALVQEPDSSNFRGLARLVEDNTITPGFNDTFSEVKENLKGVGTYLGSLLMNGASLTAVPLSPEFAEHYLDIRKPSLRECLTPSGQETLDKVQTTALFTGAYAAFLCVLYIGFKADLSGTIF